MGRTFDGEPMTNDDLIRREQEIPQAEKDFAEKLLKDISARKESEDFKQFLENIEINRKYVKGEQHDDGEGGLVRANLIHPELKKATNESYAKDPDVSISPTAAASGSSYQKWREFGKTLEIVLSNQTSPDQGNLKKKAKRGVRAADTTGFGWLKVVYQRHIEKDPLIVQRINDIQDNIQNLDKLILEARNRESAEAGVDASTLEAKREELEQQVASLRERAEVTRAEGLTFNIRPTEHVIFSSDVVSPDEMASAAWIADEIFYRVEDAKRIFGWVPPSATRYDAQKKDTRNRSSFRDSGEEYVCVYELWRLTDTRVYTLMAGFKGYIRPPYTPKRVGERFHCMFCLAFDPVDGQPFPLPLVTQLRELQDEHNTTRTNFKEHRQRAVPFNVAHGGELSEQDVTRLTNPAFMETVVLKSAPMGQPVQNVFQHVAHNPVDPAIYSTDHIRSDWEQVTRRGDAARGTVNRAKTATEADILQANLAVDTSERNDVVEDWLFEIYKYSAEILLQEMSVEQVKRIAGPTAEWPEIELTKNQVFDMVRLEIKAGSTGKPNREREIRRWLELLPQLKESLIAIAEMNQQGQNKQAEILTKLLRETMSRLDERMDLEELMPQEDPQDQQDEQIRQLQEMQARQREQAIQMKAMLAEIANKDADTMKKIAEAEAQELGTQIDQYMAIMNTYLKAQPQQQQ